MLLRVNICKCFPIPAILISKSSQHANFYTSFQKFNDTSASGLHCCVSFKPIQWKVCKQRNRNCTHRSHQHMPIALRYCWQEGRVTLGPSHPRVLVPAFQTLSFPAPRMSISFWRWKRYGSMDSCMNAIHSILQTHVCFKLQNRPRAYKVQSFGMIVLKRLSFEETWMSTLWHPSKIIRMQCILWFSLYAHNQ